jgi:hypothetical protein
MKRFVDLAQSAARLATGQLGWAPALFWESTVPEFQDALEGRFAAGAPAPLGLAELTDLETKVNADGR